MLICYNQNEGAIIGMKQYTKEEVTALSNEELLHYINYLLKNGYIKKVEEWEESLKIQM